MNILLPIETINRELDFKLVLGSLLSNGKHRIYIGQHDFLIKLLPKMYGGVYIGKNIFHKRSDLEDGKVYHLLKKHGFDIIYLHEEGAVFTGTESDWKQVISRQYSLDYFDENDVVCVWGNFQRDFDQSRGSNAPIVTTGHPRFDLYKPKWQQIYKSTVNSIKQKYGDYILVNGNYSGANHGLGVEYLFSDKGNYTIDDPEKRLKIIAAYAYSMKQMASMVVLTHKLAIEFPETNIIYRPHPSENQHYYETVFKGVSNIIVNHDGAVGPWIIGSIAVVHDGCTTAIEATLAGVPVINYKPIYDSKIDVWLPNQMGLQLRTELDVIKYLKEIMGKNEKEMGITNDSEKVCSLLYNFKGDSTETLLKEIKNKINKIGHLETRYPSKGYIKRVYAKTKIKSILYSLKGSSSREKIKYHRRKFYGIDHDMVKKRIESIMNIISKDVIIIHHNPNLIELK